MTLNINLFCTVNVSKVLVKSAVHNLDNYGVSSVLLEYVILRFFFLNYYF